GGADGPCPAVREFTPREALDLALGDLARGGGILPAVDRPEFPFQGAVLTTRAAVPQVPHPIQADRPPHTRPEAPHPARPRPVPTTPARRPPTTAASGVIGCLPARIPGSQMPPRCCFRRAMPELLQVARCGPSVPVAGRRHNRGRPRPPLAAATGCCACQFS